MPVKKQFNRKNPSNPEKNRAVIPTKEHASSLKPRLKIQVTRKELNNHSVTTFATARKKKRPKSS